MLLRYLIALALTGLAILLAIVLGDYGPWYLSWFLGTGFMVLVAVSAGVLFEAQEDARKASAAGRPADVVRVVAESRSPRPPGGASR